MRQRIAGLLVVGLVLAAAANTKAGAVQTDIFTGHALTGGGTPYSGFVGSLSTDDVQFGTNTGFNWHPFGLSAFGADIHGFLDVASPGSFSFSLNSDDGSLLFIDGSLVVDDGGPHGPNIVSNSATLAAGLHSFEVQFFEDLGGSSGVDLNLPNGVTFAAVPEPAGLAVFAILFALVISGWRWRPQANLAKPIAA